VQNFGFYAPKQFKTISRLFVDIDKRKHGCVIFALSCPVRSAPGAKAPASNLA